MFPVYDFPYSPPGRPAAFSEVVEKAASPPPPASWACSAPNSAGAWRTEARLGLRLLQRNTRHISLTPMGEQIYVHAAPWRARRTAYDLAASMGDTPSGLLRITAPSALAVTLLGDLIGATASSTRACACC